MNAVLAYILGFLTLLIIWLIFYLIARSSPTARRAYNSVFCKFVNVAEDAVGI